MSQSFKICPICDTPAHRNAMVCSTCGATLTDVEPITVDSEAEKASFLDYDHRYGETDLFEGNLRWKGGNYFLGVVLALGVIICGVGTVFIGSRFFTLSPINVAQPTQVTLTSAVGQPGNPETAMPPTGGEIEIVTNTPRPTMLLITVTPAPPTPTITDTPGPCMQTVAAGDDLISIIARCGYRNLDVLDQVLEMNDLKDPSLIQVGQTLQIPWPTPTLDPNAETTAESTDDSGDSAAAGMIAMADNAPAEDGGGGDLSQSTTTPTATLQPGVMWHKVAKDENIIIIAYEYGANVEILSQLNPEITFSQCDFGEETGGGSCIVQIYEGQLIRVPAPTPTPTLSPTPSGSETATPTPTATYNAPSALSPPDRSLFQADELITLRWVASGTLSAGQSYRVRVEDETTATAYMADTQELFFIIPPDWQGHDKEGHIFNWTVSVIDVDNPTDPYFTTQAQTFTWMGNGESE